MNSNNEEYLDSLLNSAQKQNNNNPQSALSRMSSRSGQSFSSGSEGSSGSGDIGALVNNSNGNEDLSEIGGILNSLDRGVMVDEGLSKMLDSIESPSDPSIPKFTVGDDPSSDDVRDPEEIALDEAIAAAEMSMQPIVDLQDGDDALMEMAPEISLPENDNDIIPQKDDGSDADQSPEEILTDLLDDIQDNNLAAPTDENTEDALSDVLDNMRDDDLSLSDLESEMDKALSSEDDLLGALSEAEQDEGESSDQEAADEPASDSEGEVSADDLSDLESMMDSLSNEEDASGDDGSDTGNDTSDGNPAGETSAEESSEDELASLEDALEGFTMDGNSMEEPSGESADNEEEKEPSGEEGASSSSEDEFDLDNLEASLDDLLGGEASDSSSTDGEVASTESMDSEAGSSGDDGPEDVSIPDLDALMNSLANDEIEDIENAANMPEEGSEPSENEIPKEDILSALTEDGFDDLGLEPSLGDLASVPERDPDDSSYDDEDDGGSKKKKKGKKEGFFKRLFKALTDEDEEQDGELASLTDENQQVLNELAGEEGSGKGKKKAKKEKEKKPKKEKPKKEKKPKEKKPPKPKKEKKPKPSKDDGVPEKAISPKKIAVSGIFAVSLGILICLPAMVLPDKIASNRATKAYTHKEYTTAYKMLYGKEMSDDETIIYEQSRVLAWAQRYLDGYENYMAMNMKEEALDMLLMAKRNQYSLVQEAAKFNVEIQVNSVYDSIESLLAQDYGLTEDDIIEINSIKKDREYTIRLMEIVGTYES